MKVTLLFAALALAGVSRAEAIDVMALTRKVRPSVVLLVIRDEAGHELGSGTGFIVSNDGKLITNRHVAQAGPRLFAKAWNGRLYPVTGLIATDPEQDVVLMKSDASSLPALPLGSSAALAVDTPVVVVGNPLGLDGTATAAKVAGFRDFAGQRRWIELASLEDASAGFRPRVARSDGGLQVMTPVTFGSSGSPVVNAAGEVVGIISLGFGLELSGAVPVEAARRLLSGGRPTPSAAEAPRSRHQGDLALDLDYVLASRAFKARDFAEAARRAKTAAKKFPDSATVYVLLGQSHGELRQFNDAVTAYDRVVQLRPDSAEAWYGLVIAHELLGQRDKARDALRTLEKLAPEWATSLKTSMPALSR